MDRSMLAQVALQLTATCPPSTSRNFLTSSRALTAHSLHMTEEEAAKNMHKASKGENTLIEHHSCTCMFITHACIVYVHIIYYFTIMELHMHKACCAAYGVSSCMLISHHECPNGYDFRTADQTHAHQYEIHDNCKPSYIVICTCTFMICSNIDGA